MGFYAPAQLVADARAHDVEVQAVDVNVSQWDCQAVDKTLRLGLRLVRGLVRSAAERIVDCRREGPFVSIEDLACRSGLSRQILKRLSRADVFGSVGVARRQALWQVLPQRRPEPLWDDPGKEKSSHPEVCLPEMTLSEEVVADYRAQGLSLKGHPLSCLREDLRRLGVVTNAILPRCTNGARISVAGIVLLRQRPSSARGITFVTLEDETGLANLIVKQDVWERCYQAARTARVMLATGTLQNQQGVIHVQADRLLDLSESLAEITTSSRDFR